jgi:hypothetical protein
MKRLTTGTVLRVLLLGLLVPGIGSAQAPLINCVTLPGSTTVLNPPLVNSAFFRGPHLEVNPAAPVPASVIGRQPLNGFGYKPNTLFFKAIRVRFLDNGSEGRVQVVLKQTDLTGAQTNDLATFDSNLYPASTAYQTSLDHTSDCQYPGHFDTFNDLHFLHIELTKSGTGGTPILHSIRVCLVECGSF